MSTITVTHHRISFDPAVKDDDKIQPATVASGARHMYQEYCWCGWTSGWHAEPIDALSALAGHIQRRTPAPGLRVAELLASRRAAAPVELAAYRVHFERIGQDRAVRDLIATGVLDAHDLSNRIARLGGYLYAESVHVEVDLAEGTGWIRCGDYTNGGDFTITLLTPNGDGPLGGAR